MLIFREEHGSDNLNECHSSPMLWVEIQDDV
jgi:hypothetical protein